MITFVNYYTKSKEIDFSKAPEAIKESHEKYNELAPFYDSSKPVKEMIDLYLSKLNEWLSKKGGPAPAQKDKQSKNEKKAKSTAQVKKKKTAVEKKPVKKPVKKAAKPKNAKPVEKAPAKQKPVKTSRVKTPELSLIAAFVGLNKKAVSVASFEKKLKDAEALQTLNHRELIGEIKEKLGKGIEAAKANGTDKIKATISPEFIDKCKQAIDNAKELLRVSYVGSVVKLKQGAKPGRKLRKLSHGRNDYTDVPEGTKGSGSYHGGIKKKS